MRSVALFALILLLAAQAAAAVSSTDAIKFVTEENRFLFEDEEAKQPNFSVRHDDVDYWVIPVLRDESPTTFFAVPKTEKKLQDNEIINRKLFQTADFLREFLAVKETFSKNPQAEWVVTSSFARQFERLAGFFQDEVFQLNTIESSVEDAEIKSQARAMKSKLSLLASTSASLAMEIDEAAAFEARFATEPNTGDVEGLQKEFNDVFELLSFLEEEALAYRNLVQKLKQDISVSSLEAGQKSFLIQLADAPQNLNQVGSAALSSLQLKDVLDNAALKVNSRLDNLLNEFHSRRERAAAYAELYGEHAELLAINSDYRSISFAVQTILREENKPYWKDQTALQNAQDSWRNAERYFQRGEFELAKKSAESAISAIQRVHRAGFIESEPPSLISQEFIVQAVAVLAGLLVLVWLVQNRERFLGGGEKEGEEVEVKPW